MAQEKTFVVCVLEWFVNPDHLPLFVAKERGYFDAEGLEVAIVVPTVAEESLELVGRGKADFGVGEQSNVILAASRGLPVLAIGPLLIHTVVVFMVPASSEIASPADLRGKIIGWPGIEIDLPFIHAVTEHAGLTPDDYDLKSVGFNLTEALVSGEVDAVFGAFRNYEGVEAALKGTPMRFFHLADYGVPDLYQLVFLTHRGLAEADPDICRRFMRAVAQGLEATQADPVAALEAYLAANPTLRGELTEQAFAATLPFFPNPEELTMEPVRWAAAQEFLHARGVVERTLPLEELFTDRFVTD
ncbi:MAG: ABC transporter substrate-binding protein [Candidatus Tectimicrobiota bacterium]